MGFTVPRSLLRVPSENKRGLTKLVRLLLSGEVKRLVITNKDRLLRFGAELIFSLCEQLNVEVTIINHDVSATPEQELVQDVLEVITVFSARASASQILLT